MDLLSKFDITINNYNLLFFFEKDVNRKKKEPQIKKENLLTLNQFKIKFNSLCKEGRAWINISGVAKLDDKNYLISCEYSEDISKEFVFINLSGPSTDICGNLQEYSDIKVN